MRAKKISSLLLFCRVFFTFIAEALHWAYRWHKPVRAAIAGEPFRGGRTNQPERSGMCRRLLLVGWATEGGLGFGGFSYALVSGSQARKRIDP